MDARSGWRVISGCILTLWVCLGVLSPRTSWPQSITNADGEVLSAQELIATFATFLMIPTSSARGGEHDIQWDSLRGQLHLHTRSDPGNAWRTQMGARMSESHMVDHWRWEDDRHLIITTRSLLSTVAEVLNEDGERVSVVLGELRQVENPRMLLLGERCAPSLSFNRSEMEQSAAESICQGNLNALDQIHNESQSGSIEERDFVSLLESETVFDLGEPDFSRFSTVLSRTLSSRVRFVGVTSRVVIEALIGHLPEALDLVNELIPLAERLENSYDAEGLTPLVSELGNALHDRLIESCFAHDDMLRMVYYAERFRRWGIDGYDRRVTMRLAEAYRMLALPHRAIDLYLDLVDAGEVRDPVILENLISTYLEAGDLYRARETAQYYQSISRNGREWLERVENARLLAAAGDEASQSTNCERELDRSNPLDLIIEIGCAQRTQNWSEAIEAAQVLARWTDADNEDATALYQGLGRTWTEAIQWEMDHGNQYTLSTTDDPPSELPDVPAPPL